MAIGDGSGGVARGQTRRSTDQGGEEGVASQDLSRVRWMTRGTIGGTVPHQGQGLQAIVNDGAIGRGREMVIETEVATGEDSSAE